MKIWLPDGKTLVHFPDGTSEHEINTMIGRDFPTVDPVADKAWAYQKELDTAKSEASPNLLKAAEVGGAVLDAATFAMNNSAVPVGGHGPIPETPPPPVAPAEVRQPEAAAELARLRAQQPPNVVAQMAYDAATAQPMPLKIPPVPGTVKPVWDTNNPENNMGVEQDHGPVSITGDFGEHVPPPAPPPSDPRGEMRAAPDGIIGRNLVERIVPDVIQRALANSAINKGVNLVADVSASIPTGQSPERRAAENAAQAAFDAPRAGNEPPPSLAESILTMAADLPIMVAGGGATRMAALGGPLLEGAMSFAAPEAIRAAKDVWDGKTTLQDAAGRVAVAAGSGYAGGAGKAVVGLKGEIVGMAIPPALAAPEGPRLPTTGELAQTAIPVAGMHAAGGIVNWLNRPGDIRFSDLSNEVLRDLPNNPHARAELEQRAASAKPPVEPPARPALVDQKPAQSDQQTDLSLTGETQTPAAGQSSKQPWEMTRAEIDSQYPKSEGVVDGRVVRSHIPNMSSINSSVSNVTELPGIREVPLSMFEAPPVVNARTKALAEAIKASGEINPLIVVVDEKGPYILEGSNRYDAMKILGAKSIPAKVVIDEGALFDATKNAIASGKPVRTEVLAEYAADAFAAAKAEAQAKQAGEVAAAPASPQNTPTPAVAPNTTKPPLTSPAPLEPAPPAASKPVANMSDAEITNEMLAFGMTKKQLPQNVGIKEKRNLLQGMRDGLAKEAAPPPPETAPPETPPTVPTTESPSSVVPDNTLSPYEKSRQEAQARQAQRDAVKENPAAVAPSTTPEPARPGLPERPAPPAAAAPAAGQTVKQPWEMTKREFHDSYVFTGMASDLKGEALRSGSYFGDFSRAKRFANLYRPDAWHEPLRGNIYAVRRNEIVPIRGDAEGYKNSSDLAQRDIEAGQSVRSGKDHVGIKVDQNDPHQELVKEAISRGDPVPPEVLAEYPDLAKQPARPAPPAAAAPAALKPVPAPQTDVFHAAQAEAQAKQAGTSGEASGPAPLGGEPPIEKPAEKPPEIRPLEQPELVKLVSEFGSVPQIVKKIRLLGGQALGSFKDGIIRLRGDMWRGRPVEELGVGKKAPTPENKEKFRIEAAARAGLDPENVKVFIDRDPRAKTYSLRAYEHDETYPNRTMAHEIGHYADFVPEGDLRRGNALGHIGSLFKFMKNMAPIQYGPEGKRFSDTSAKDLRTELQGLSAWWKPFDRGADPDYTKYRDKPSELYADSFSVLMNSPEEFQTRAPKFAKAFFDNLDKKPDVKQSYDSIQEMLRGGGEQADRLQTVYDMQQRGREKSAGITEALAAARKLTPQKLWTGLLETFVSKRTQMKQGTRENISPENDPFLASQEIVYNDAFNEQFTRDIQDRALKPLADAGATLDDANVYAQLQRAATERKDMANPGGIGGSIAADTLEGQRQRLGPEKFAAAKEAVGEYWKLREDHIFPILEKSGLVTPEMMNHIRDNVNYATFKVQKFMDAAFGSQVGAAIHKQFGTLQDVDRPFEATIAKDMSLVLAAKRNEGKRALADGLEADLVKDADKTWENDHWKFHEPRDPKQSLLIYMDNGKPVGKYVPKEMARFYDSHPVEADMLIKGMAAAQVPFKALFTEYNPGFGIWNVQRDIRAMVKQLPGTAGGLRLLPHMIPAARDLYLDAFLNKSSPIMREMYLRRNVITDRGWRGREQSGPDAELEARLDKMAGNPAETRAFYKRLGMALPELVSKQNKMLERFSKATGFRYLKANQKRLGLSDKQIDEMVRSRAGSPDFKENGLGTAVANNLLMFFNPGVQGWSAAVQSAKEHPVQYAANTALYDVAPKLLTIAAAQGMFGSTAQQMMAGIPAYDKENRITVPVGLTKSGKTVYVVLPQDHVGQFVGAAMQAMYDQQPRDLLAAFQTANPMDAGQLNPGIKIGVDLVNFLRTGNVYDAHYGNEVLDQKTEEAGGVRALVEVGKYELNNAFGQFYKFKGGTTAEVQAEFEKALDMPVLGNMLRRFVRVSGKGNDEKMYNDLKQVKASLADNYLTIKQDILVPAIQKIGRDALTGTGADAAFGAAKQRGLLEPEETYSSFLTRYKNTAFHEFGTAQEKIKHNTSKAEKRGLAKFNEEQ